MALKLDSKFLEKLSVTLTARINELEIEIKKYAGAEVNVSSPKQLAECFFRKAEIQENARVRKTAAARAIRPQPMSWKN